MKTTLAKTRHVLEQLQAGADAIASCPAFARLTEPRDLLPLVLHVRGSHNEDYSSMRAKTVTFAGKAYVVRVRRCGIDIADL